MLKNIRYLENIFSLSIRSRKLRSHVVVGNKIILWYRITKSRIQFFFFNLDFESQYRTLTARANYLALDRPDIQYANKEICRGMSNPTRGDLRRLRRLGRYLVGRPGTGSVWCFEFQDVRGELTDYTDSDWADWRKTVRSTSNKAIRRGRHTLKTWTATQKNVTLSSGEAELETMVKISCEMIDKTQLTSEWGLTMKCIFFSTRVQRWELRREEEAERWDTSRLGPFGFRRKNETDELQYTKVQENSTPADLMTKNVVRRVLDKMTALLQQHFKEGRTENSLHVQTVSGWDQSRRRRSAKISSTGCAELVACSCVVLQLLFPFWLLVRSWSFFQRIRVDPSVVLSA